MSQFRFQDLEIWKLALQISMKLFDIADKLEIKHLYRFAEQLRGSGLGMTNNISEGSGSNSKKDFINFLNFARRSVFENANITIILFKRNLITEKQQNELLNELELLSKKIISFQRSLK
jgi:four helix bundle protein